MSLTLRKPLTCAICAARAQAARASTSAITLTLKRSIAGTSNNAERLTSIYSATMLMPPLRTFSAGIPRLAAPKKSVREVGKMVNMQEFPPERIRRVDQNLSIIAHIDHGKSTLADRLLQMTNTVPATSSPQFLDKLKVERERGITVKAQTVSIIHKHTDGNRYLINLIDTPGHVDFSYEVSRSLGACEGGLLLVDCTQGIQAQTLSVFHVALEADLTLLAVINKVDLEHASPEATSEQIDTTLGLEADKHMFISAKSGLGVDKVLTQIVDGLPPPRPWKDDDRKFRGLVFDTYYDHFRGVVALVRVFSGSVQVGDKIRFLQADRKYEVLEIGINNPEEVPVDILKEGQVGYLICSMKNSEEAHIGDTVCLDKELVEPLPGFKPMKAMVYAGVFPMDSAEFTKLEEAIERLTLNDRSVSIARETSAALSQGFRLGFLGTLHMDVFRQRLEDEYSSNVIVTAPTVPYKVIYTNGTEEFISNPTDFPDLDARTRISRIEEPIVNASIIVPNDYIGMMMDLCSRYRATQLEYKVLETTGRSLLRYTFPLAEIVTDFFSELKSASSGFASFDYEEAGYERSDLVKLNILLNSKPVDALAMIVHRSAAQAIGGDWCKKLKKVVPKQMFELAIQAAIGTKVVARETISANRKDVTAGLYGGHWDRKQKQLDKQKEGKKRLKHLAGNINMPQSAFFDVLSSRPRKFSTMAARHDAMAGPEQIERSRDLAPPKLDETFREIPRRSYPGLSNGQIMNLLSGCFPRDMARDYTIKTTPEPKRQSTRYHRLSALERSKRLSNLHKLLQNRVYTETSLSDLHAAFTAAVLADPTAPPLSPTELKQVIQAIRRISNVMDRTHADRAASREMMLEVVGLMSTMMDEEKMNLEKLLLLISTRSKWVYPTDGQLDEVEQRLRNMEIGLVDLPLEAREGQYLGGFVPTKQQGTTMTQDTTEEPLAITERLNWVRKTWQGGLSQLLYMCAVVGDSARFHRNWQWGVDLGIRFTSYDYLALMRMTSHERRIESLPTVMAEAMDNVENASHRTILFNILIGILGDYGMWAEINSIYRKLHVNANVDPDAITDILPLIELEDWSARSGLLLGIDVPDNVTPSAITYKTLSTRLSTTGYLEAALQVFNDTYKLGFTPGFEHYTGLFRGFVLFGQRVQNKIGAAAFLFPSPPEAQVGRPKRSFGSNTLAAIQSPQSADRLIGQVADGLDSAGSSAGKRRNSGTRTARNGAKDLSLITDIWSRGADAPSSTGRQSAESFFPENPSVAAIRAGEGDNLDLQTNGQMDHSTSTSRLAGMYNIEILQGLFGQFMGLVPQRGSHNLAPTPNEVGDIMAAFNRVSNGDPETLLQVFRAMEDKFTGVGGEAEKQHMTPYEHVRQANDVSQDGHLEEMGMEQQAFMGNVSERWSEEEGDGSKFEGQVPGSGDMVHATELRPQRWSRWTVSKRMGRIVRELESIVYGK